MTTHRLKIWPEFFEPVRTGEKTFEIRSIRDRMFNVEDGILLAEWSPDTEKFTGRYVVGEITYITDYGQAPATVVFSFKTLSIHLEVTGACPWQQ